MVLAKDGQPVWSAAGIHEGDFGTAAKKLLEEGSIPSGIKTLITGNEGRSMCNV